MVTNSQYDETTWVRNVTPVTERHMRADLEPMWGAAVPVLRSTEFGPWPTRRSWSRRDCRPCAVSVDRSWAGVLGEGRSAHSWTCQHRTTYSMSNRRLAGTHVHLYRPHTMSYIALPSLILNHTQTHDVTHHTTFTDIRPHTDTRCHTPHYVH